MEYPPFHGPFNVWLKQRRETLALTQAKLGASVAVSTSTITSYELGRLVPSIETTERLAQALGIDDADVTAFIAFARSKPGQDEGVASVDGAQNDLHRTVISASQAGTIPAGEPPIPAVSQPFIVVRRRLALSGVVLLLLMVFAGATVAWSARHHTTASVTPATTVIPSLEQWPLAMEEHFADNHNHWGLGTKNDGTGILQRSLGNGVYTLTLTPAITIGVFLGGDSTYFSPATFYLTTEVTKLKGDDRSDCGVLFDEVSDAEFSMFHLHDAKGQYSVDNVVNGGTWRDGLPDHKPSPSIRPGQMNKLGVLGDGNLFTFFINDVRVDQVTLPRAPNGRLDVSIAARTVNQPVVCQFDNFVVRVPPH